MSAQYLNAVGPGPWVAFSEPPGGRAPSILCGLSAGAVLIYNVEVSGDSPPPSAQPSNVFPLDASSVGLTASQNFTITSLIWWVRVNITSYTSGTLTFQVVQ